MNKYSGSNFDDFLVEEGILEEVSEGARKRLLALQIEDSTNDTKKEFTTCHYKRGCASVNPLNR